MKDNKNNRTFGILLIISIIILLMGAFSAQSQQFPGPSDGRPLTGPQTLTAPPEAIETISPACAFQGKTGRIRITIKKGFEPPDELMITSIQIGNIYGKDIERDGADITAEFTIPSGEKEGLKNVSVTFPGPYNSTVLLLKQEAFQIKTK